MTPTTTSTPTPSLVKTSLKRAFCRVQFKIETHHFQCLFSSGIPRYKNTYNIPWSIQNAVLQLFIFIHIKLVQYKEGSIYLNKFLFTFSDYLQSKCKGFCDLRGSQKQYSLVLVCLIVSTLSASGVDHTFLRKGWEGAWKCFVLFRCCVRLKEHSCTRFSPP